MRSEHIGLKHSLLSKQFKNFSINQNNLEEERQKLLSQLHQKIKKRKQFKKIAAGNMANFDITHFFKFPKKQSPESLIDQLSGGYLAWLVLAYSMFNNALVLPWMMSIDADRFLRLAWRHMLFNLILVPFLLYQKRASEKKQMYQLKNIFKIQRLANALIVSISKGCWLAAITSCFQYSAVAHVLILSSLMNFFLSINRFFASSFHFLETGGQIFVIVGIFLILKQQVLMNVQNIDRSYQSISFSYYGWHTRLVSDVVAICISIFMAISYKYTSALNKDYPSYLGMFIVNSIVSVFMFFASYLFHGASFDRNEKFGIFGVIDETHFTTFFQLSVFIGFGMVWSYALISKLFPQPLIPALGVVFQPIFSLMIMDYSGLQQMPSGYTMMAYIFIIPGLFLILIGQNIYQKIQKQQEKKLQELIKQIFQRSIMIKQNQHLSQGQSMISPFVSLDQIQIKFSQEQLKQNAYQQHKLASSMKLVPSKIN